jgi:hypothetical protein
VIGTTCIGGAVGRRVRQRIRHRPSNRALAASWLRGDGEAQAAPLLGVLAGRHEILGRFCDAIAQILGRKHFSLHSEWRYHH